MLGKTTRELKPYTRKINFTEQNWIKNSTWSTSHLTNSNLKYFEIHTCLCVLLNILAFYIFDFVRSYNIRFFIFPHLIPFSKSCTCPLLTYIRPRSTRRDLAATAAAIWNIFIVKLVHSRAILFLETTHFLPHRCKWTEKKRENGNRRFKLRKCATIGATLRFYHTAKQGIYRTMDVIAYVLLKNVDGIPTISFYRKC